MWKRVVGPLAAVGSVLAMGGLAACAATTPNERTEAPVTAPIGTDAPAGLVTFRGYDRDGEPLTYDRFVDVMTNGAGPDATNDALLDPQDLTVMSTGPIHAAEDGTIIVDRPAGPSAISFAWPSRRGYSTVVLDLPDPGSHLLNLLLAEQALADAMRWNVGAPGAGTEYATWKALYDEATASLRAAEALRVTDPQQAAALADQAFDMAVEAALLPRWSREPGELQAGVTIDTTEVDPAIWESIARLAGGRQAWARIVFDSGEPPSTYAAMVEAAHAAGVKVLGQFLDSSAMAEVPLADFELRVRDYVQAFELEAWEVGNEINGSWLGPDAAAKALYAAAYVRDNTSARTMLTLYWSLGEDDAQWSTFSWIEANVTPELRALLDDVSLSVWVEQNPLGAAFDRVFATLATAFPDQRILLGELGYGNDDLDHRWWWGDEADLTGVGRNAVAADFLAPTFDRPWLAGGGYWWYYAEDAFPPNELWEILATP